MSLPESIRSRSLILVAIERFLLFLLLLLTILLFLPLNRAAGSPPACAIPHYQPAAVVATAIPFTFVTYSPPGKPTRDELERRLLAAEKKIESLQSAFVPRIPTAKGTDFRPVVAGKCQTCHAGSAEAGGGFVMPADPTQLSPQKRQRIVSKVNSGDMPPREHPPLTDDEREAITAAFAP